MVYSPPSGGIGGTRRGPKGVNFHGRRPVGLFSTPAGRLYGFSTAAGWLYGLHRPLRGRNRGGVFPERSEVGLFFTPEGRLYGFINDKRFKSICEDIVK